MSFNLSHNWPRHTPHLPIEFVTFRANKEIGEMKMSISIGALVLVAVTSGPDNQIQELQKMVQELRQEVSELKMNQND